MKNLAVVAILALGAAVIGPRTEHLDLTPQPDGSWPHWRGPLASGEAPGADPPVEFDEGRNVRWKVGVPGRGASTPIVWGDTIYLQTAVQVGAPQDTKQQFTVDFQRTGESVYYGQAYVQSRHVHEFQLLALDRATGALRWRRTLRTEQPIEGRHPTNTWASASPVTDGEHLIAAFGSRGLYGLTMAGDVLWERDFGEMTTRNGWGEGSSPVLHGHRVVVTWDHEGESFIAALDKATGREVWRRARSEPTTWATPLVARVNGRTQVITTGTERVQAYDLETGDSVWHGPGLTFNSIPSPIHADGVAYLTSGFQGSVLLAIDLAAARGDVAGGRGVLWRRDRDTPYVASPLAYRGSIYLFKGLTGILTVLDARSGAVQAGPLRFGDLPDLYASPVAASGRIYVAGRDGAIVVLRHGDPETPLAVNRLDDGFDASPAAVGSELYLRGRQHLYRIDGGR